MAEEAAARVSRKGQPGEGDDMGDKQFSTPNSGAHPSPLHTDPSDLTTLQHDPSHRKTPHCDPSDLTALHCDPNDLTTSNSHSSHLMTPHCDPGHLATANCNPSHLTTAHSHLTTEGVASGNRQAGSQGSEGDRGCNARKLQKADSGIEVEKSPSVSVREGLSDGDGGDSISDCWVDSTGLSHSESFRSDDSPCHPEEEPSVDSFFLDSNIDNVFFSASEMTATAKVPKDEALNMKMAEKGSPSDVHEAEDTSQVMKDEEEASIDADDTLGSQHSIANSCKDSDEKVSEEMNSEEKSEEQAYSVNVDGKGEEGTCMNTDEKTEADTCKNIEDQNEAMHRNAEEEALRNTEDAGEEEVFRNSQDRSEEEGHVNTEEKSKDDEEEVNNNPWPKHKWNAVLDLRAREIGITGRTPPSIFREKVQGSLYMIQRLKLQYKMEHHEGCVNSLHFNRIGTLLASGADDLQIVLWNWARNRKALVYDSGHRSNVFQAKFMPYSGDCHVVSCARDGQVRLSELSLTGVCKSTKKLAQHRGAAHKLALEYDSPHVFLSCGEDALTFQIDLREDKPKKLIVTKENDSKVPLYSIHSNPINPNEFLTSGRDPYVRIYDKRKINENVNGGVVKKYCPQHLDNSSLKTNVTCACYSYNGSEIVGSYNDEDIYVFENTPSTSTDAVHRYTGHRNNATVKGVSFYGPRSEYIVTGSDCGHVFLWDKETEHVVQFLEADHCGVVNVLEPHPFAPVLATSGLDHDVKIWSPISHDPPKLEGLERQKRKNRRDRRVENECTHEPEMIDGQMLWFIMNHFRRSARRRLREGGEEVSSSSNSSDSDDDNDNDDEDENEGAAERMQCQTS